MRVKITNWKKISASTLIVGAIFSFLILQTKAATDSDAIAVRIMPNTNHDSIETWYANQGYKGSPQSLMVDGYEAIRDGRTVFVNAANLDTINKKIYTNIYLISYNQESGEKTLDILGQLVSHWKFNNNITTPGTCSISTKNCQSDSDCTGDYICSNYSSDTDSSHGIFASNKGKCILKTSRNCNIDSDCPVNLFCDSLKARSIRDVKRLGSINQINKVINSYKVNNGSYPSLQSGTYIPGASLSVWPSWKEALNTQLGLSQLLVDPINSLGYCDGYDSKTCWSNTKNSFVNTDLVLPVGSYSFIYKATKNGLNYLLCSVFETKNLGYDTADKKITSNYCAVDSSYTGVGVNTAPSLVSYSASGETGKEFNGYIKVVDKQGDLISWKLGSLFSKDSAHSSDVSSWSSAPILQDTGDANQKKLYAVKAGVPGNYDMILTLTDNLGAVTTAKINIVIGAANKPIIEAEDTTYFVDPIIPLKYTFYVQGSNSKPTYTFTPVNAGANPINSVPSVTVTSVGLNKNKIDLSFLIPTSNKIAQDVAIPFRITAKADGATVTKDININLKVEKPVLDSQCENMARTGQSYPISGGSCLLGKTKSGNHDITYKILSGPDGLLVNSSNGDAYLSASIVNLSIATTSTVKISASNEYGASFEKSFNLKINTFCGDGIKQKPNTEGRGGLYNDGVEECDGVDGVATGISTSSAQQYSCTSGLNIKSPYPILDNNSCVFRQGDSGGGYCGDGLCQLKVDGSIKETGCNCPSDCLTEHSCCGDGVITGAEVCDTGLPTKACTDTFSAELPSYCGGIPMNGVQTCKSDCSGWGDCELQAPTIESLSSEGCSSTNPKMTGYSCCELVSCVNDSCGCCGRYQGASDWIDLLTQATNTGYAYKKILSPNSGVCTVSPSDSTICVCGSAGCSAAPLCPKSSDPKGKTNNSCVLAQSNTNLKDWTVLTNHTAAAYRCWK